MQEFAREGKLCCVRVAPRWWLALLESLDCLVIVSEFANELIDQDIKPRKLKVD